MSGEERKKGRKLRSTKSIVLRQADNMMGALRFAREIGTPLNSHLTIHWGGTGAGDDPHGDIFAKFRNLFDKRLQRLGVRGGLTAIWVRERQPNKRTGYLSELVHNHMLFHLPSKYDHNPYRNEIIKVIEQLVELVGNGIYDDRTIALTFPDHPDGIYLLKGGTSTVRKLHNVPKLWCSLRGEGVIEGKRCGTTQNIGPANRALLAA